MKDIHVTSNIASTVPNVILGDMTRLRQILINLVGNALKFTHEGQITITVTTTGTTTGAQSSTAHDTLQFCVQDTGIGISADRLESLFESFSQADSSTTRKYGGTGLGLTISKRLVEMMGGSIWVESTLGTGSQFYFTIPTESSTVKATSLENTNKPDSTAPIMAPLPSTQPVLTSPIIEPSALESSMPKMLLVEDNVVNQKVALRILQKLGYQADLASNGVEAVEAVQIKVYDIILMDVHMPEMDGLEATQRIHQYMAQQTQSKVPRIIAMTAAVMEDERKRMIEAGMDGFIAKPVRLPDLKKMLDIEPSLS
ncbi:MAG: ATP-binding protein [Chloroflexota bacterium]